MGVARRSGPSGPDVSGRALPGMEDVAMPQFEDAQAQRAQARFIRQSMAEPLLSRDREYRLARSWRENGDADSLQELIRAYTRPDVSLATKLRTSGFPRSDPHTEGTLTRKRGERGTRG